MEAMPVYATHSVDRIGAPESIEGVGAVSGLLGERRSAWRS
jgi:hypothetical protein